MFCKWAASKTIGSNQYAPSVQWNIGTICEVLGARAVEEIFSNIALEKLQRQKKKRSGLVLPVKERERMGSKSTSWGVEKKEERIQAIKGSTRKKTACYVGGAT